MMSSTVPRSGLLPPVSPLLVVVWPALPPVPLGGPPPQEPAAAQSKPRTTSPVRDRRSMAIAMLEPRALRITTIARQRPTSAATIAATAASTAATAYGETGRDAAGAGASAMRRT